MQDKINQLFDNLEGWKNLPKYQLERRLDIFFTVYLKEIVEDNFSEKIKLFDLIIPEFPLKKDNNQSVNVDYVMFSENFLNCFFIELKTDMSSKNLKQDDYLLKNSQKSFSKHFFNISDIHEKSKHKDKYQSLLDIFKNKFIKIKAVEKIHVIYILPINENAKENYIDFYDIVKSLERHNDLLSTRFKKLLAKIYIDSSKGCKADKKIFSETKIDFLQQLLK